MLLFTLQLYDFFCFFFAFFGYIMLRRIDVVKGKPKLDAYIAYNKEPTDINKY